MQEEQPASRRAVWLSATLLVLVLAAVPPFVLCLRRPGREPKASSVRIAHLSKNQLCGPYSLHTAASMLGFQVDLPPIVGECRPSANGVSMGTLRKVAAKLGLKAQGYRMSWDRLLALQSPAILYVNPRHFVTVNPSKYSLDAGGAAIRVFDSDKTPQWWARGKLEKSWSGETLVISEALGDKPLKGPRIKFDSLIHDLGDLRVPLDKKVDISLAFASIGDESVKIGRVKTTCGCTETSVTPKLIDPGQRGRIDVAINLENARGPFDYLVIVETNDRATPIIKTRIAGRAFNTQITSRTQLVLNATPRQGQTSTRLLLRDPGDASLRSENVKLLISPPLLTDDKEPIHIEAVLSPYDRDKHAFITADSNDLVIEIYVTVGESAPIGEFGGLLEIVTQVPGNEHITIPLRGAVISNIVAEPPALFFFSTKGDNVSKSITITSRIGRAVDLQTIYVLPNLPLTLEKQNDDDKAIVLTATYSASSAKDGTVSGNIVCTFTDDSILEIPVVIHSQTLEQNPVHRPTP